MFLACTLLNNILFYIALKLKTSALKGYITLAFCILVIDTRKEFQLQTSVFLKRPDVVTFDDKKMTYPPDRCSNLFLNAYIDRHVHVEYLN